MVCLCVSKLLIGVFVSSHVNGLYVCKQTLLLIVFIVAASVNSCAYSVIDVVKVLTVKVKSTVQSVSFMWQRTEVFKVCSPLLSFTPLLLQSVAAM